VFIDTEEVTVKALKMMPDNKQQPAYSLSAKVEDRESRNYSYSYSASEDMVEAGLNHPNYISDVRASWEQGGHMGSGGHESANPLKMSEMCPSTVGQLHVSTEPNSLDLSFSMPSLPSHESFDNISKLEIMEPGCNDEVSIRQQPEQPVQQTEQPPVQQTERPPVQQTEQPPVQQTEQPPVQQTERPPVHQTEQPPVQQTEQPPVQQTEQPPAQQTEQPPVQQIEQPPVQQTEQPSVQQTEQPPVQQTEQPPVQQTERPPVQQTERPPVHQTEQPPVKLTEQPPVHQTEWPPVHQTEQPPVQQTEQPPVQQTEQPPVKLTDQPPVQQTEQPDSKHPITSEEQPVNSGKQQTNDVQIWSTNPNSCPDAQKHCLVSSQSAKTKYRYTPYSLPDQLSRNTPTDLSKISPQNDAEQQNQQYPGIAVRDRSSMLLHENSVSREKIGNLMDPPASYVETKSCWETGAPSFNEHKDDLQKQLVFGPLGKPEGKC